MNATRDSVMVVEDDAELREALVDTLRVAGIPCLGAEDAAHALRVLEGEDIALVISDVQMPEINGHQLLSLLRQRRPDLPVILMTAYGTVAQAVAAMRDGATDYIIKPFEADALIKIARHHISRVAHCELIAVDPVSKHLVSLARKFAESDATILITGESGTGKEVYARFIRDNSPRANRPFVAINCAAIPENMLEATLFGHEKGAFTGAVGSHAGKFEQAQGGTLLLDEISEMDLGLQAKILRVLQEREVERVGGNRTIQLDVRVVATSNRDLPTEVRASRFRADLFYRLNVMSLNLPPLRLRRGDILPLAYRAIETCARSNQSSVHLSTEAEQRLVQYDWPGNARELANTVQRATWLASGAQIAAADLDLGSNTPAVGSIAAQDEGLNHDLLNHDLKERERELIFDTLRGASGSRKLTAQRLGISSRTLRHKLQQLRAAGIDVPQAWSLGLKT